MTKLLLNADGKVLMSNDKVYKAPNNINIPQVTNIQLSENGVLTWDTPDITSLAEYNPTISYVINVNGTELTSTGTSKNVIDYLIEGDNNISIITKAVLNDTSNSNQQSIVYSLPQNYAKALSVTLPNNLYMSSAAAVGTNAYIFGGSKGTTPQNTILKFDTVNETITTLDATLPNKTLKMSAAAVGTNIYLFGGTTYYYSSTNYDLNTILKFDTTTETITTLDATLPNKMQGGIAAAVGTDIYIFEGNKATGSKSLLKFDTTTETITTLDATLPSYSYNTVKMELVGNIFYIITGNDNNIYLFDTSSLSYTSKILYGSSFTIVYMKANEDYIYLMDCSSRKCTFKYDILSQTTTTMDVTLSSTVTGRSYVTINNVGYLFGGQEINTIVKVELN